MYAMLIFLVYKAIERVEGAEAHKKHNNFDRQLTEEAKSTVHVKTKSNNHLSEKD
jgi:hypothetical protein